MNCDRCGKPSVYHSTLIVNGVSQSTNLCRECAIKEGVFSNEPISIFDSMLSAFADMLPNDKADLICPACKMSLKEFRTTNKLGCPNCYEVFRDEIASIVKKISPYTEHKQQSSKSKRKTTTKEDKINSLRQEMKLAVDEERYEDAAKLKKQINDLEGKNE